MTKNNNMTTTTDTTSRGSTSSSNGLLTVTIASSTHPHGPSANDDDDDLLVDPDDPFNITQTKNAPPETLKRWRVSIHSFILFSSFLNIIDRIALLACN
jgi:hypothetical protein